MYKILVVDDDETCLRVARACLRRFDYYEVIGVTHPLEALSLLGEKREDEKSYDVILADVHMPIMDGIELMQHVNNNFNIPVVLISADDKTEIICKGFSNGAPAYWLKPVTTADVKHLWQYSVLWKNRERNAYKRFNDANIPRNICSSSYKISKEKNSKEPLWNANLHNRFVEALLVLGPLNDVPRKILDVMNVPALNREQVGSHLQKFRKFLKMVLDGEASLHDKYWIDCNYYSRIVQGNPNLILLNQLREEQRTGILAAPIPASLPLPPFNETETSSSGSRNVQLAMPNNYSFSSMNVASLSSGLVDDTFQSAENVCTPNYHIVASQPNYQNFSSAVNGGLMGRTTDSMFSSINYNVPSNGTTPIPNQFTSQHPFNMALEGNDILFDENNFSNLVLQMENEQLNDPNTGTSFGANQFGFSLGMNNEQVGSVQSSDIATEFENALATPMNEHASLFGSYGQKVDGRWIINNNN